MAVGDGGIAKVHDTLSEPTLASDGQHALENLALDELRSTHVLEAAFRDRGGSDLFFFYIILDGKRDFVDECLCQ